MIPPCAQNVLLSSGCDDLVSSVTSTLRLAAAHAAAHPASPLPMIRISVLMSVPFYRYVAPTKGENEPAPWRVTGLTFYSMAGGSSRWLDLETDVNGRSGMRQGSDGNTVHTSLCKSSNIVKRDPARCFHQRRPTDAVGIHDLHRLTNHLGLHFSEKNRIHPPLHCRQNF